MLLENFDIEMKKTLISIALMSSLLTFYGCKDNSSQTKNLTKEITFTKEGELNLLKAENDSIVATLDIEIADNEYETQTGLMYRQSMEQNQAMLFIFPDEQNRSFYMKNTKIPLDIIYLNSNLEIVTIHKNAKPFDETSLPSETKSRYVLEVNAGLSDIWNLEVGDKIQYTKTN